MTKSLESVALDLLGAAVALAPAVATLLRRGAEADPQAPLSARVLAILPEVGASERAENELRALAAAENGQ